MALHNKTEGQLVCLASLLRKTQATTVVHVNDQNTLIAEYGESVAIMDESCFSLREVTKDGFRCM